MLDLPTFDLPDPAMTTREFAPHIERRREASIRCTPINVATTEAYRPELMDAAMRGVERAFFAFRAEEWLQDTRWLSSMASITEHPQFAAIKAMGESAVQLILERLQAGDWRLHWFPVLRDVTGVDPVPPHGRGCVPEMAAAWIAWGRRTGRLR